jgi:membrane protein EpsK
MLGEQFATVLMPLASDLHAGEERSRLRAVQVASTRVALAIFLVAGCPLLVLAGPFLSVWVGPRYAADADIVWILLGAGLAATAGWPSGSILSGMGRNRALAVFTAGSAMASVGLSIALVHPFGLRGAALGVLIGTAAEAICLELPYAVRITGVPTRSLIARGLLPSLLPAAPALGILYLVREAIQPASLAAIGGVGLLGAAVYAACYLSLPVTSAERELVKAVLSRSVPFWSARSKPQA